MSTYPGHYITFYCVCGLRSHQKQFQRSKFSWGGGVLIRVLDSTREKLISIFSSSVQSFHQVCFTALQTVSHVCGESVAYMYM